MLIKELDTVAAAPESAIEHLRLRFGVLDHGEVLADEFVDFTVEHWIMSG